MSREETYKINFELNKDEILKDIKEIRDEVKSVTKEIDTDIKYIRLKRKDILIVKVNMFLKNNDKDKIEKRLKKKLHRKVLVLDNTVSEIEVVNR